MLILFIQSIILLLSLNLTRLRYSLVIAIRANNYPLIQYFVCCQWIKSWLSIYLDNPGYLSFWGEMTKETTYNSTHDAIKTTPRTYLAIKMFVFNFSLTRFLHIDSFSIHTRINIYCKTHNIVFFQFLELLTIIINSSTFYI